MDINEYAKKAVELKSSGYNCCQAVTAALSDLTGLSEEVLTQLSSGFGSGMGTMDGSCGALIGAVMVSGMSCKGRGAMRMSRQIITSFKERCGAVTCKELKGYPGGKVLCPCDECVKNAVLAFGEAAGL